MAPVAPSAVSKSRKPVPQAKGEGWSLWIDSSRRLRIDFVGPTPTAGLEACLQALDNAMPAANAEVVVDLLELVGHNPDSRDLWKHWLARNKSRIGQITVVLPDAASILKMVAAAVGLAVGVKLRVSATLPE